MTQNYPEYEKLSRRLEEVELQLRLLQEEQKQSREQLTLLLEELAVKVLLE